MKCPHLVLLLMASVSWLLAGCGGGGGADSASTQTPEEAVNAARSAVTQVTQSLAADLTSQNVTAAATHFAPAVRADYQTLMTQHPTSFARIAGVLPQAQLTYVSAPSTVDDQQVRYGEMKLLLDGGEFYIELQQIDGTWYYRTL
jgi:hypothetical protein